MRFNSSDLHIFLAVARAGKLTGAATRLGINHATLSSRIMRIEAALGCRLFDSLPSGSARKVAEFDLGLYASNAYLFAHEPRCEQRDLHHHELVGYIGDLLPTSEHAYQ